MSARLPASQQARLPAALPTSTASSARTSKRLMAALRTQRLFFRYRSVRSYVEIEQNGHKPHNFKAATELTDEKS